MNKCFKCHQETAKPGEIYYRFNKLGEDGSPAGFNIYCCSNCWDNHKEQILKEDKSIIQVSQEQDNLHQIVYSQLKCSKCNKWKKAQCQCNQESSEKNKDYIPIWFHKEIESLWYLLNYYIPENKEEIINTIAKLKEELSRKNKNSQAYREGEEKIREIEQELNKRGIVLTTNNSTLRNQNNSNNVPKGAVPSDSNNSSSNSPTQANKGFNWKHPGVIAGGIVLAMIIVGSIIYFLTRNKAKNHESK